MKQIKRYNKKSTVLAKGCAPRCCQQQERPISKYLTTNLTADDVEVMLSILHRKRDSFKKHTHTHIVLSFTKISGNWFRVLS